MQTCDVVIAGAGIIGLSLSLELAAQGLRVTVLERGAAMREASWAAAGMLAARDPENPPQLRGLAELSLALYPEFLARVEELSGMKAPLRTSVALQGVYGAAGLDRAALRALVPELLPGDYSFIQLDEPSIDPRDLCRALPLAARAASVKLCEYTEVLSVKTVGEQVVASTSEGRFVAPHYVHCTGAWAASTMGRRADTLAVEPRKGQIMAVTMPAGGPGLSCVLRTPEIYLAPRGDGRIVVGATVERAGFDRTVADCATEKLLTAAAALWPPIKLGRVTEQWTGLRPYTPDGLPILSALIAPGGHVGDAPGPRQWVATGHFRNGILLAPSTARVLRQMLLGQEAEVDLRAFRAERWAAIESLS